jgi:integrase
MGDPTCWSYQPGRHKSEHHDRDRVVFLGPKAVEIIRPFLTLDISGYLFSPRRAVADQNAVRRAERKTRLYQSHVAHQAQKRKARHRRELGDHYTVGTYRQAIHRACDEAGVPRWHPHQLRHSRADEIERAFDTDATKASLGHSSVNATKVYLSRDLTKAKEVAKKIG